MNIKGLHTAKKIIACFAAATIMAFSAAGALAQEPLPLTIGQTNVFTTFNFHEVYFANDTAASLAPWPVSRDAQSEADYASVSLSAKPGEAGQAFAGLGVQFDLALGGYMLPEALAWPVVVTFDVTYEFSASWQANSGSAYAGIGFPGLLDGSFDMIGFTTGEAGVRSNTVKAVLSTGPNKAPLTVKDFLGGLNDTQKGAGVMIYCQAATPAGVNAVNSAAASVTVHSITIEFLERSQTTTTTSTVAPDSVIASFVARPLIGAAPLAVRFLDTSIGNITAWSWQFGDGGSSAAQHPQHTYTSPGVYDVSLTVAGPLDKATKTKPGLITVTAPAIVAGFDAAPRLGAPPLTVQFTDRSASSVVKWYWEFGDGTSSTVRNPTHTYSLPGVYTVVLSAGDNNTFDRKAIIDCIHVIADAPAADFSADPVQGIAPLKVQFSDQSSGTIAAWLWEFGDGQNAAEQHPQHIFSAPGVYTVGLGVKGSAGADLALKEGYITVQPDTTGTLSISGKISGEMQEEVAVFLSGDERRMSRPGTDGTYIFTGLHPGSYIVTPFAQGAGFDPPSTPITITDQDISTVDFSLRTRAPAFLSILVEPARAPADGSTPVLFVAQTAAAQNGQAITEVILDLRPIGGALQAMADDGTSGDDTAGDGIYAYQTAVAADTPPGPKGIRVGAFAGTEARSFAAVELGVINAVTQTLRMNSSQRGTIQNEIQGQTLIWQFALAGEQAASRVRSTSDPAQVIVQLFDPESAEYLETPLSLSAQVSEIQIADARQGAWIYEVTNQSAADSMYSLSVATAGTGVISGMVVDASSGSGIDGASVSTNGGGSSATEDGYFILVHPAGMFTVQARGTGYLSATQSVTVSAGQSKNLDMALSIQESDNDSDNNTCVLSAVAASAAGQKALDVVRLFRDAVLTATPEGRRCIDLYYAYSSEVIALVQRDPGLRAQLRQCLIETLPLLRCALSGRPQLPGKQLQDQVRACLVRIRAGAGRGLQAEITRLIDDLDHNRFPEFKAPRTTAPLQWFKRAMNLSSRSAQSLRSKY